MPQNVLTNDEVVTGSKHFFSLIFVTFLGNKGTFVLVPISSHPTGGVGAQVTHNINMNKQPLRRVKNH
jgi:hypothetical protein